MFSPVSFVDGNRRKARRNAGALKLSALVIKSAIRANGRTTHRAFPFRMKGEISDTCRLCTTLLRADNVYTEQIC